jgi:putative FmdB family regulatory protein
MPIFEFECLECGIEFERLLRNSGAASEVACPICGSSRVEQKLSTFASMSRGGSTSTCAPSGG